MTTAWSTILCKSSSASTRRTSAPTRARCAACAPPVSAPSARCRRPPRWGAGVVKVVVGGGRACSLGVASAASGPGAVQGGLWVIWEGDRQRLVRVAGPASSSHPSAHTVLRPCGGVGRSRRWCCTSPPISRSCLPHSLLTPSYPMLLDWVVICTHTLAPPALGVCASQRQRQLHTHAQPAAPPDPGLTLHRRASSSVMGSVALSVSRSFIPGLHPTLTSVHQ